MKFLIGILVLLFLVLVSCSVQTIVKYQCVDGSFVDSVDYCIKKIEPPTESFNQALQSQENKVEEKRLYYIENGKYFCKNIEVEVIRPDFCDKLIVDLNRTFEDVNFTLLLDYNSSCDFENPNYKFVEYVDNEMRHMFCIQGIQVMANIERFKWYDSLQEGKLYQINTFFMNEGKKKLKIRYSRYIYNPDGILIDAENNLNFMILHNTVFGDDLNLMSNEGIFYPEQGALSYQKFGEQHNDLYKDERVYISPNALDYVPINKKGNYTITLIVYDLFTNKTIANEHTILSVN